MLERTGCRVPPRPPAARRRGCAFGDVSLVLVPRSAGAALPIDRLGGGRLAAKPRRSGADERVRIPPVGGVLRRRLPPGSGGAARWQPGQLNPRAAVAPIDADQHERGAGGQDGREEASRPAAAGGRRRSGRARRAGAAAAAETARGPAARRGQHEAHRARRRASVHRSQEETCAVSAASATASVVARASAERRSSSGWFGFCMLIGPDALIPRTVPGARPSARAGAGGRDGCATSRFPAPMRSSPPPRRSPCHRRRTAPPRFAGPPAAAAARRPGAGTAPLARLRDRVAAPRSGSSGAPSSGSGSGLVGRRCARRRMS